MIKILEYTALERPIVAYDLTESRYSAGPAAVYARPNDPSSSRIAFTSSLTTGPDERRWERSGVRASPTSLDGISRK
jgi:hypothetical protein